MEQDTFINLKDLSKKDLKGLQKKLEKLVVYKITSLRRLESVYYRLHNKDREYF